MANTVIENRLRQLTQDFVRDLLQAFRDTFATVVGGESAPRRGRGRPANGVSTAAAGRVRRGGRRSPAETEAVARKVADFVSKQPKGVRVGDIGRALGLSTGDLMLPIAKALEGKLINKTGQRRATTYLPKRG